MCAGVCMCMCVLVERRERDSVLWEESVQARSIAAGAFPRLGESEVSLKDGREGSGKTIFQAL